MTKTKGNAITNVTKGARDVAIRNALELSLKKTYKYTHEQMKVPKNISGVVRIFKPPFYAFL